MSSDLTYVNLAFVTCPTRPHVALCCGADWPANTPHWPGMRSRWLGLAVMATHAKSVALAGFGLDSLIEIGASLVVI